MDSKITPDSSPGDSSERQGPAESYVRPNELGKLLAQRRRKLGLSLSQVSRETGVSPATLSRWERKQTSADPHKLEILARWLDVQLDPATSGIPRTLSDPLRHQGEANTVEFVQAHLRADRNLDSKTAAVLARVFQTLYEQYVPQQTKKQEGLE